MQQPPVYFHFPEIRVNFQERNRTKKLVTRIFREEGRPLQRLDYIFCSDEYLLQMNQQWLQHDTYTDIITFDLSLAGEPVVGEIYISIDRVKENAGQFGTHFQDELRRVIFHGALHLCGYKDKTKAQRQQMRLQEEKWLKLYSRST